MTLWQAAHDRADGPARELPRYALASGRPMAGESVELPTVGIRSLCAMCGGSMQAVSRKSGDGRLFYGCIVRIYWNRGASVCDNGGMARMDIADAAIRELLATDGTRIRPESRRRSTRQSPRCRRIRRSDRPDRSTEATPRRREDARESDRDGRAGWRQCRRCSRRSTEWTRSGARCCSTIQASSPRQEVTGVYGPEIRRSLRGYVNDWHAMIQGNVSSRGGFSIRSPRSDPVQARDGNDGPGYELTVPIAFDRLLVSLIPSLQVRVASPTGFEPVFWP